MKKIFKIFTFISLITLSYAQGLDKKSVFYNLGDAVEYAHQMNLNVLIEDFTGVDWVYCPGASSALDTLIERYPNTLHVIAWHVPWYTPDTANWTLPGAEEVRRDLYHTGTSTPMLVFVGDSIRIGGNIIYWWENLYPTYESIYQHFVVQDTPYRMGISGQYEPGNTDVNFTVELLIEDIDSTLDNTNMFLELVIIEDHIPNAYWSHPEEFHDLRDVARKYITKSSSQKLPITITESGQNQIFESSFSISDFWNPENIKIVAMVQMLTDSVGYCPILQSQSRNINDLDPDPDEDGVTYLYDNCTDIYNPDQIDSDGDEVGDICDACNGLVNVLGNVDLDASGDDFEPIIGVSDILALSDIIENVGMPANDCHELDILQDEQINSFDLIVLVDLVMAGGE